MRFIRSLQDLQEEETRSLLADNFVGVTIGNFDGMHPGHQALFAQLKEGVEAGAHARNSGGVRVLMTFAPHPREVLARIERRAGRSGAPLKLRQLTPLRCKVGIARELGFDLFFAVHFNEEVARLSPEEFVKQYLVEGLGASLVVVGYDWSFGKGRSGSGETLRSLGRTHGFEAAIVPAVTTGERRFSSSLVRDALAAGDFIELRTVLGRNFEACGYVVRGDRRGRDLGFPTANIKPLKQLLPPDGVYVTIARFDERTVPAVTNVGVRPSFGGGERLVETYLLLDEPIDLYSKFLRIEFTERIRDELKFNQVDELIDAMNRDVEIARQAHRRAGLL